VEVPRDGEALAELGGCPFVRRDREKPALGRGKGVNFKVRSFGRGAQAEPAERVAIQHALLVEFAAVSVAAAMLLINREFKAGATGKAVDGFRALEDRAVFRIAPERDGRRRPA